MKSEDIVKFLSSRMDTKSIGINREIINVSKLDDMLENSISWSNSKNIENLKNQKYKTVICNSPVDNENITQVIVNNPRMAFSMILKEFFQTKRSHRVEVEIKNTKIGKNVNIGKGTIIEDCVEIGDNTYIGYNNVILKNTIIGSNVSIGHNNTIGELGFGYEKDENGNYEIIPHIGNVIIEDNVEIGNNNCIDRAVLGSTILRKNSKIDNLIHIAHGVEIGENSLIIANSMIAGSVKIGKNSWISPSTSIINKTIVGDNSMTGIGSVVIKPIPHNELHIGVPSKKLRDI
jgi:UDP-3-O-[3-hydroxymyristoyl] glucosamine N-acyltransferase